MNVPIGTKIENPNQQMRSSIKGYASGSAGVGIAPPSVAPMSVQVQPKITVINVMSKEEAVRLGAKIPGSVVADGVQGAIRNGHPITNTIEEELSY